jgi:hypothetical protein
VVLHGEVDPARHDLGQGLAEQLGAEGGQLLGQGSGGVVEGDRHPPGGPHRSGIEPGLHAHDRDPRLVLAADDRPLDRGRAPQLGQQRGVHVVGAEPGEIEQRLRQDPAVGYHDEDLRFERGQRRQRLGCPQLLRLEHGEAHLLGRLLHRRRRRPLPAARRPIGLADHGTEVGAGRRRAQAGDRERRRPEEHRARAPRLGHSRAL